MLCKRTLTTTIFATLALAVTLLGAGPAQAVLVFSDDFEGGATAQWTTGATDATETASFTEFLGRYNNGGDTLTLTGLPAHTTATLHFDLYLIDSWDGDGEPGGNGADEFAIVEGGANTIFSERFCNNPDVPIGGNFTPCSHAAATGAPDVGPTALGFGNRIFDRDSIYRDPVLTAGSLSFAHSSSTLTLEFKDLGLQELADESWGIDNVRVEVSGEVDGVLPEPGTLAVFGLGLAGLGFMRRRSAA